MNADHIRKPAVAGRFYPADARALELDVLRYVDDSGVQPSANPVVAVIGPHAGFRYSGPTAGAAYACIRGHRPGRVVLLGCSHYMPIESASIVTAGAFEIPGALFPVDEPFAQQLAQAIGTESTAPHGPEHSLETHLPFLAATIGEVPIVPVLFGGRIGQWHLDTGALIAAMLDPGDLIACSTDLSHYLPEDEATQIDQRTLACITQGDPRELERQVAIGNVAMCGATAVAVTMAATRADAGWRVVDYRTSARASGDRRSVVGYGALSLERAA